MSNVVAIYLRISTEDSDLKSTGKSESESITNQRNMLTDYVKTNFPDSQIREFCDDGWSGKNFDRPAVKDMLNQVKNGEISCIVVKDLSRFGRDYLEVGNYISRIFPFMGLRFIALGDGFDSIRQQDVDSLSTSFKTIIYDLYSRELSRKVKSAKRRKAEQGAWVCGFTPFGYIKNPDNINHLIADPISSKTVRYIFDLALEGKGSLEIARILNAENVTTPMQHKLNVGTRQKFLTCINEDNYWMQSAVARILRDERYTGKNIYGRRARDMVGDSHTLKTQRDTWVVVEDAHDAIITQEEFEQAQAVLRAYHTFSGNLQNNRPLRGKIFCGLCGHAMYRSNGKNANYYCRTSKLTNAYSCKGNVHLESDMIESVLATIRVMAKCVVDTEKLWVLHKAEYEKKQREHFDQLRSLQSQKAKISNKINLLYENLIDGILGREEYLLQKRQLSEQMEHLAGQISASEQKCSAFHQVELQPMIETFKQNTEIDTLSDAMSAQLLKKVTPYPDGTLDIELNFADELETLLRTVSSSSPE